MTVLYKGAPRKSGIVDEGYFYVKKSSEIFFGHLSGVVNILCQKVVKTGQVVQEPDLGGFRVLGGVLMVKK